MIGLLERFQEENPRLARREKRIDFQQFIRAVMLKLHPRQRHGFWKIRDRRLGLSKEEVRGETDHEFEATDKPLQHSHDLWLIIENCRTSMVSSRFLPGQCFCALCLSEKRI